MILTPEPIRILQISYAMNRGGAETLIMNLYRNINRNKVQFDFLLHDNEESEYEAEIKEMGGIIYRIPRFLGYNKLSYDRELKKFLISHPEYHIIHDHLMDSASETFKVAKKLGRITIAHSHIANVPFSISNSFRFFFRKNLYKISDYRFACSEDAGNWLYRGKADFKVLNNGIETQKYSFSEELRTQKRKELGIDKDEFALLTIGRMVPQKNQKRLINIFCSVLKNNPKSSLTIIGEGPLENELKTTVKELGIEKAVSFLGVRSDIPYLLNAFDAFVLPSLFEGLGIVLVEAEASGLPCIFTNTLPKEVDLIPNLIHRVSLTSDNDTWANVILNSEQLKPRSLGSELIAKANYDIKKISEDLESFYLSISK